MKAQIITITACLVIGIVTYLMVPSKSARHGPMPTAPENGSRTQVAHHKTRNLHPIAEDESIKIERRSPAPLISERESARDKMNRLLLAVNSRETALDYLQGILDQDPTLSMSAEEMPRVEIVREEGLSTKARASFQKRTSIDGKLLIPVRVDGQLTFHEASPYPVEVLPSKVRGYLSDQDIRDFQDKMIASSIERSAARTKRPR